MDMETAAENVEEAAKDVNRLVEYVNSQIPNIINFGLKVVLSLICFFIGRKLIRWVQKLVRASLNRANVEMCIRDRCMYLPKMELNSERSVTCWKPGQTMCISSTRRMKKKSLCRQSNSAFLMWISKSRR